VKRVSKTMMRKEKKNKKIPAKEHHNFYPEGARVSSVASFAGFDGQKGRTKVSPTGPRTRLRRDSGLRTMNSKQLVTGGLTEGAADVEREKPQSTQRKREEEGGDEKTNVEVKGKTGNLPTYSLSFIG